MKLTLEEHETLLACPFDGTSPNLHHDGTHRNLFWVKCDECGVSPEAVINRERAIADWNRRA